MGGTSFTTTTTHVARVFLERWLNLKESTVKTANEWATQKSAHSYIFSTGCCGAEILRTHGTNDNWHQLGGEFPRISPDQADLMIITGTISLKQAQILKAAYQRMPKPNRVICFGACASSGGLYQNYATVSNVGKIVPVDVYLPGCPPSITAMLETLARPQGTSIEESSK